MKRIAILIVLLLALVASPALAGTGDGLLEVGWEDYDSGRVVAVQFHESLYGEEADIVRDALWGVYEQLPSGDSYLAVVRYPEMNRYYVRISNDRHIIYAIGTGPTFQAAVDNLVQKFK